MRSALLMGAFLVCWMGLPALAHATPDLSVTVTAGPDPAVPSDDGVAYLPDVYHRDQAAMAALASARAVASR